MPFFFPLFFIFVFALSSETYGATCRDIFLNSQIYFPDVIERINEIKMREVKANPAKAFEETKEEVLSALDHKRRLQPHPAASPGWLKSFLAQALYLDFRHQLAGRGADLSAQAARLIWGSPDLLAYMTMRANQVGESVKMAIFYEDFIDQVVADMMGESSHIRDALWEELKLSLYRVSSVDSQPSISEFDLLMEHPGVRGFILKSSKTSVHYAAMNSAFHYYASEKYKVEEVNFDEADEEGLATLALAQYLHLMAFMSDRWSFHSYRYDQRFMETLSLGDKDESRVFMIEFFSENVARTWQPPVGITVRSQMGPFLTIAVSGASRLLFLDSDLRIRSFSF